MSGRQQHTTFPSPENYRKSGQVSMEKMFAAFSGKDSLLNSDLGCLISKTFF
jgi:hypothetical protein